MTFRPPFEAKSLLLQVTTGCSHNKCSFCTMYRDVPFGVESMEQIEKDLWANVDKLQTRSKKTTKASAAKVAAAPAAPAPAAAPEKKKSKIDILVED